jgi:hypothetical protein
MFLDKRQTNSIFCNFFSVIKNPVFFDNYNQQPPKLLGHRAMAERSSIAGRHCPLLGGLKMSFVAGVPRGTGGQL